MLVGLIGAESTRTSGTPPPSTTGQPIGLLLSLTYAGPTSTAGQPIGLLLALTKAS